MERKYRWAVELATEISECLSKQAAERFHLYAAQFPNLTDSDQLFMQYAHGLDPEPLNLAHVFRRVPYNNPAIFRKNLIESVSRGWLTIAADGAYGISSRGSDYVAGFVRLANECYLNQTQMNDSRLDQLACLLDRIDGEIASYAGVGQKHAWQIEHRLDYQQHNPMVLVWRRLIYLLSYREDAYVAAWSSFAIEGYIWEAFSYVASEQANTSAQLTKALSFRNYNKAAYQGALDNLVARGWLVVAGNQYRLTTPGKQVRDEVERCTDNYFNAVFSNFAVQELKQLKSLLQELAHRLMRISVLVN